MEERQISKDKKNKLLKYVAPCSLLCYTCSAYCEGVICQASQQLVKYTEGMREFYAKHCVNEIDNHDAFIGEIKKYSNGLCKGCRNGGHNGCSIAGCCIPTCIVEHDVDYCGECTAFPCDKVKGLFEDNVYKQWLEGNKEIKKDGIEEYFNKHSKQSHYISYHCK